MELLDNEMFSQELSDIDFEAKRRRRRRSRRA